MKTLTWLGALALFCACSTFASEVVTDAIKLSNAKVSDEVIIAWAETQRGSTLNADAIVQLKNANVSEKVIAALVKSGAASGGVRELERYDVPAVNTPRPATATATVNTDSLVQYTYSQPARTVYVDSPSYTYPSYTYASYSPYYSSYPYYSGYSYPRYYGSSYYGSYWPRSYLSIGFGSRGWGGGHWHGSHWHGRCR